MLTAITEKALVIVAEGFLELVVTATAIVIVLVAEAALLSKTSQF